MHPDWREIERAPFALVEFEGKSVLYRDPQRILAVREGAEIDAALEQLRGADCVGFIGYEAGHALERALPNAAVPAQDPPLLWFMLGCTADTPPPLPDPAGAWAGAPSPLIGREDYLAAFENIRRHIFNGDVYQVNLTFPAEVKVQGHPLALYAQVRERAGADWGALVFTGEQWILSFSPELFFTCSEGQVTTRPMKGTAAPHSSPEALRNDPKQRAENLMIVDLLRNDLSRVAKPGSVKVPELFTVEHYPTVLQMTSTVTAMLDQGLGAVDLLRAIFPCGSVSGAPKIRAMQIIGEQESAPRGVYTGAIGTLSANGDAAFNVAIRTLVLPVGGSVARLGLGSGIVADSIAADEWDECSRKGSFVPSTKDFHLLETMRILPDGIVSDLEAHLDRMEASSRALGFTFDRSIAIGEVIAAASFGPAMLRLRLSPDGRIDVNRGPFPHTPDLVEVIVAPSTTDATDFRRRHKTSDRAFYDRPRQESGAFEVLFVDQDGFLTEGSFNNLFVERNGRLLTPPLERGLLPGILRQRLMESGQSVEADLRVTDLADGFFIGNALRGLIPARLKEPAYA